MPRLHFVQELPVGSSKRDKELERAKARAHAASVSYQSHHTVLPPRSEKSRKVESGATGPGQRQLQPAINHPSFRVASREGSSSITQSFSYPDQYGPHTPPDSPERRESIASQPFQPVTQDTIANAPASEVLTPPDSSWSGSVADEGEPDTEHVEDVLYETEYSTSFSSASTAGALVASTARPHHVYQINPHVQYSSTSSNVPWISTSFDVNTIPHDLLGTRADPFDCIPHRQAHSASVNAVTDYHAQIMAPNHAPIYKIFNVTNVYTSYYFELLSHPDFLYTGVASVQAIIDHLRRRPDEPVGPSEQVMKHIGTAMARLRKRLGRVQKEMRQQEKQKRQREHRISIINDAAESFDTQESLDTKPTRSSSSSFTSDETLVVDDMTIMTVLFLAVVTRAINDMPSHEIHKKTIASLVAARGGLQNLNGHDGLARCTLMQWESFWALNTGTSIFPDSRPPYAPEYPTPLPVPALSELGVKIASLPVGFRALADRGSLALDVIEVLARCVAAHAVQAAQPGGTGSIVTDSDVFRTKPRRFRDFWEACTCLGAPDQMVEIDVWGVNLDTTTTTITMVVPNLEKQLVLALLLYCLHTFSPMRAVTAVYNGSRMKLGTDLPKRAAYLERVRHSRAMQQQSSLPSSTTDGTQRDLDLDLEEPLLLWISFNLADSWRAANDMLLPQGLQVMRDTRRRFPHHTAAWESCEAALRQFFHNERFMARCRMFWDVSEEDRVSRLRAGWMEREDG